MLKVIKYDIKSITMIPLLLIIIFSVINIITSFLLGYCALSPSNLTDLLKFTNGIAYACIVLSLIYIGIIYLIRETKYYLLYELNDTPIWKLIFARYIMFYIIIALVSLIIIIQVTLIHIIANAYYPKMINTIDLNFFVFSMFNQPLLSYLFALSIPVNALLIYSIILIVATVIRRANKPVIKALSILFIICFSVFALIQLLAITLDSINIVNFARYNFASYYIPRYFMIDSLNKTSFLAINIFNMLILGFTALFMTMSILFYSLRIRKQRFSKFEISKIIIASMIAIALSFTAIIDFALLYKERTAVPNTRFIHRAEEIIVMNVGDRVDLNQIINKMLDGIDDYNQRLIENEISYQVNKDYIINSDKVFEIYTYKNNQIVYSNVGNCFIDNNFFLHAYKAGIYCYSVRIGISTSIPRNYEMHEFMELTVIVNDYDYSDYIEVYDITDFNNSSGNYILKNNIIFDTASLYYADCFNEFNGIIINPFNYSITINRPTLFNEVTSNAILNGLIINTNYISQDIQAGIAISNYGAIINCKVIGNLSGSEVGGLCVYNRGVLYNNFFSGKIEADRAGGLCVYYNNSRNNVFYNTVYVIYPDDNLARGLFDYNKDIERFPLNSNFGVIEFENQS